MFQQNKFTFPFGFNVQLADVEANAGYLPGIPGMVLANPKEWAVATSSLLLFQVGVNFSKQLSAICVAPYLMRDIFDTLWG